MELISGIDSIINKSFSMNSSESSLFCSAADVSPSHSREFVNARIINIYLSKCEREEYIPLYSYYIVQWEVFDGVFKGSVINQKLRCMHRGDAYGKRDTNTLHKILSMNGCKIPAGEPTEEELESLVINQRFNLTKLCVYEPGMVRHFVGHQNNHKYIMVPVVSMSELVEVENEFYPLGRAKRFLSNIFG